MDTFDHVYRRHGHLFLMSWTQELGIEREYSCNCVKERGKLLPCSPTVLSSLDNLLLGFPKPHRDFSKPPTLKQAHEEKEERDV